MGIYLNNAATTYPKPESVSGAVFDFMTNHGANFSRGSASVRDLGSMNVVLDARESLAVFFGAQASELVTFTSNVTHSLNTVINGYLRPGMCVLTTSMEHNAVIRPLRELESHGVVVKIMQCDSEGYLQPETLRRHLEQRADLVVLSHASNVCGSVQDLPVISEICAKKSVPIVIDAAQSAGHIELDITELNLSAICFTGHKGLWGPQGIGGIVWNEKFAARCAPLVRGGTGSFSHEETQPTAMPDKFESGTPNMPGIAGLAAGIEFINAVKINDIAAKEDKLGKKLYDGLREIPGLVLHGPGYDKPRLPVFAMNFGHIDNAMAADILSREFVVETRPGLHCSPLAHKTLGSFPHGALRISPGYFNTEEEISYTLRALHKISRKGNS